MKTTSFGQAIKQSYPYLKKYRALSWGIVLTSFVGTLFEGVGITSLIPLFQTLLLKGENTFFQIIPVFGETLEKLFSESKPVFLLLFVFFLILTKNVLTYVSAIFVNDITNSIRKDLQNTFFQNVIRSSVSFFDKLKGGTLVGTLSVFAEKASEFIFSELNLLIMLIRMLVYFVLLLFISPILTVFSLVLLLVLSPLIRFILKKVHFIGFENTKIVQDLYIRMTEMFQNVRLIKLFRMEKREEKHFDTIVTNLASNSSITAKYSNILKPFSEVFIVGIFLLCVYVISVYFPQGVGIAPSLFLLYIYFFFQLFSQVNSFNHLRSKMHERIGGLRQYEEMVNEAHDFILHNGEIHLDAFEKEITFQDVNFSYQNERAVLRHINLSIEHNSFVAFVGPTGSGKSTLAHLLTGLYQVTNGTISIDGVSLHDIEISSWLEKVSYVTQEAQLFHDSILHNVAYGQQNISPSEVEEACRIAQIHDFILSLPEGYDTIVGDRGVLLSGGQRQRIALARALLKNHEVLILDEATSALDSQTEMEFQKALLAFRKKRTLIVIAHRLSTIQNADTIFVLDGGRIVEQGKHEDLIQKEGLYKNLYALQVNKDTYGSEPLR